MSTQIAAVYRFGVFEFDARSAELRKNGMKLKLQEQPRQVLIKLLEHPGEVVTRDELRSSLWCDDTFVDFETGLNAAVKRLRETLGDSADNPTFVETVPRRGYRFIAPIELRGADNPAPVTTTVVRRREPIPRVYFVLASVVIVLGLLGVTFWANFSAVPRVSSSVQLSNDGKAKISTNTAVTDGVHLYFVEGAPWTEGSGIAQMSAIGGETTHIATPLKEVLAISDISPNRTQLLVLRGIAVGADSSTGRPNAAAELWIQPLPGGTPHRLSSIYAITGCFAPDGQRILYSDGRSLMSVDIDGGNPREIAKVPGVVRGLRYSPDGKRIRFYLASTQGFDNAVLWEVSATGENLHPLLPDWKGSPFQCCGNWSADGSYYYFQAGRGPDQAIWVMPERNLMFVKSHRKPARLILGPLRFSAPSPSLDGKKLFVVGDERRVEPLRYNAQAHRYESYLPGISAGPLDVSPDRKWIAYVSYPDMNLWRCRPDGSERMQLTFPPVRAYGPRWSPDGSKIALMDVQFDRPWRVVLVPAIGGPPQPLPVADSNEIQSDATWMPDGKGLIFGRQQNNVRAIFRVDQETGSISEIPGSPGLFSPRLSPDGRFISAFTNGQTELMLYDILSNRWSSLAKGALYGNNAWSHDGKYVYVRASSGASTKVIRIRVRDGAQEDVLDLKDFPQLVDIYMAWIGLTPDDEPILIRDRSVQELYALNLE